MGSSLFPLKVKIIAGYALLVLFFLILLALIYQENRRMSDIDTRSATVLSQRKQVEAITVQILDIALLSEQVLAWNENDIAAYRTKQEKTTILLQTLQKQITGQKQHQRIDSILTLLSSKEIQTFAIRKDLDELRTTLELFHQRMPGIIRKTQQDKQELARQIVNNYGASEKKNGGLLGLFHSRKKAHELTDKANEAILKQSQARSGRLLHSLADEIQRSNKIKSERLLAHIDSLSRQNTFLNLEISRLLSELSVAEQQQTKEKSAAYLLGQEQSLRQVSLLGIGAMLLAIVCYLILHLDLKKRYRYREQLEQLNRNNEDLLRTRKNMMLAIAHDIRGPLNSIGGSAALALGTRGKKKRDTYLQNISSSCNHILRLVNNLLDVYRLNEGKETVQAAPFRLQELSDRIEREFAPLIAQKGLVFHKEIRNTDVTVYGDSVRIEQIADNLLSNATKFTPSGEIRLIIRQVQNELYLEVADTGIGMKKEDMEKIFQPFERTVSGRYVEGFGLGLTITLGLVKLLNGSIDVKSAPGKGSTFSVRLPLPVTDEPIQEDHTQEPDIPVVGLKVLAIDDDPVQLAILQEMLVKSGMECEACLQVSGLTEQLRTNHFDLLITDIQMAGTNGFEVLELLGNTQRDTSQHIPVLAMTAREEYSREYLINAGFTAHIYKPFSANELVSVIHTTVSCFQATIRTKEHLSALISETDDPCRILELFVQETRINTQLLQEQLDNGAGEEMRETVHKLFPLWEFLQEEGTLQSLRTLLQGETMDWPAVRQGTDAFLRCSGELVRQANELIHEMNRQHTIQLGNNHEEEDTHR